MRLTPSKAASKPLSTQPEEDRKRSLFGEILDWILAPLLLLWPMSIAITYLVAKSIANHPFDRALDDKILVLSQQIKQVDGKLVSQLSPSEKRILRADAQDSIYFQLSDAQHTLIDGDADFPATALAAKSNDKLSDVQFRYAALHGAEIRIAARYVSIKTSPTAPGQTILIQVGETLEKRSQLANEIIKGVIFPQFIILPIGLTLIWLALTRGLAPLLELQQRIRARKSDDLSPIISGQIPEEILPLVDSFNEMLDRLSLSISIQKRFIADAAHQMKTPLAGMRMQSELALRHSDQEEIHRSLIQLAKSSESATHLVNQLLSLARAENLNTTQLRKMDLSELARQVASDWVPKALNARIDLGLEVPDQPVYMLGNSLMLRELINNLIDNALHYTQADKSVTLRIKQVDQHAVLEVEDQGIGINPAEVPHIFERFYRILNNHVEGSGLGLAIVREIAQQHGADIAVEQANPGTLFRISFPDSPPENSEDDHAAN